MSGPSRTEHLADLRIQVENLAVALTLWVTRDATIPQPDVTAAGYAAIDAIDAALRDLHGLRSPLVSEIRQHQDDNLARADQLIARGRQERGL